MNDSLDRIRSQVEARTDELVELLASFVRIPAENPPGNDLMPARAWITARLEEYGIRHETHLSSRSEGDHAVIVGQSGAGDQFLYMHGHYDVVPAFSPDQFIPDIRDGAIYGRGTSDMKSGVVAMLMAAVVHQTLGGAGQVRLVFVPDEETGGADGSERMTELGLIETEGCVGAIVGEPSFPDIWYAARGAFTVEVTVRGRPAHVGLHYQGLNAFEHGHEIVGRLREWRDRVATHKTAFRIEPEAARSSIVLLGGVSAGGTNFNIVPDEFKFTIDRRPNPDEDYDDARAELVDLLNGLKDDYDLSFEVLQDARPASIAPDEALVRSVQRQVEAVADRHAALSMCPGCLETRIYSQRGIPAVAYGPGPMAVMHAPDEHVPVANLVEACAVYTGVLGDLLGYSAR